MFGFPGQVLLTYFRSILHLSKSISLVKAAILTNDTIDDPEEIYRGSRIKSQ